RLPNVVADRDGEEVVVLGRVEAVDPALGVAAPVEAFGQGWAGRLSPTRGRDQVVPRRQGDQRDDRGAADRRLAARVVRVTRPRRPRRPGGPGLVPVQRVLVIAAHFAAFGIDDAYDALVRGRRRELVAA